MPRNWGFGPYITVMNRRSFLSTGAAAVTLSAFPTQALGIRAGVTQAAMTKARFWALYTAGLHGSVTASSVATLSGVSQAAAQKLIHAMIAQGALSPQMHIVGLGAKQDPSRKIVTKVTEYLENDERGGESDAAQCVSGPTGDASPDHELCDTADADRVGELGQQEGARS